MVSKTSYRVNPQKAVQLIAAGVIASAAMVIFAYLLRAIGIPAPDFAAQYGAIFNDGIYPDTYSGLWWAGFLWHAINGAVLLPFIFDFLAVRRILQNQRWVKGLIYGAAIWLVVGLTVAPMAGEGFFFRFVSRPEIYAITALMSWLVYGAMLDGMTRVPVAHNLHISDRKAA